MFPSLAGKGDFFGQSGSQSPLSSGLGLQSNFSCTCEEDVLHSNISLGWHHCKGVWEIFMQYSHINASCFAEIKLLNLFTYGKSLFGRLFSNYEFNQPWHMRVKPPTVQTIFSDRTRLLFVSPIFSKCFGPPRYMEASLSGKTLSIVLWPMRVPMGASLVWQLFTVAWWIFFFVWRTLEKRLNFLQVVHIWHVDMFVLCWTC